jgi:inosine-uridine nucleoside N-ribohydrolase
LIFLIQEWYEKLISLGTRRANFIREAEKYTAGREKEERPEKFCALCDQAAMAVAIDNSVALETMSCYATVELQGSVTRGQTVVDWPRRLGKEANVRIVTALDQERFLEMIVQGLSVE